MKGISRNLANTRSLFVLAVCVLAFSGQARAEESKEAPVTTDDLIHALDPHGPKMRGLVIETDEQGAGPAKAAEVRQASLHQIQFDFNSDKLTQAAEDVVRKVGEAFNSERLRDLRFEIHGHTDARGTAEYNRALSQRRAAAVKSYLVSQCHVSADRLVAIGDGKEGLAVPSEPDSAANRRVVLITINKP